MSHLGQETIIALDSSDISKEFGGGGMEGMEKGYDTSRDTTAMGHNILCASLVLRHRVLPLCLDLLKGRHGLPKAAQELFNRIAQSTQGKGIVVCDRGFDSEPFACTAYASNQRTVIRIKHLHRDLFSTNLPIDRAMKSDKSHRHCDTYVHLLRSPPPPLQRSNRQTPQADEGQPTSRPPPLPPPCLQHPPPPLPNPPALHYRPPPQRKTARPNPAPLKLLLLIHHPTSFPFFLTKSGIRVKFNQTRGRPGFDSR